jgi:hypothetical protein
MNEENKNYLVKKTDKYFCIISKPKRKLSEEEISLRNKNQYSYEKNRGCQC